MHIDTITGCTCVKQLSEEECNIERISDIVPFENVPHEPPDKHRCRYRHKWNDPEHKEVKVGVVNSPCSKDEDDNKYCHAPGKDIEGKEIFNQSLLLEVQGQKNHADSKEKEHKVDRRGYYQELEIPGYHPGILDYPQHAPQHYIGKRCKNK